MYAGPVEASAVPPEWHAWLHYTTDAPLPDTGRKVWQKPHLPNATGTAAATGRPGMTTRAETAPARRAITKPGRRASNAMARHGVAEVLTGAIVLLVAVGLSGVCRRAFRAHRREADTSCRRALTTSTA